MNIISTFHNTSRVFVLEIKIVTLRAGSDIHGRVQDAEVPEDVAIGTEDGKTITRLKKINPEALWNDTGLIELLQQRYTTNIL